SLSGRATAPVLALQHERYRTHRAVRALFELLASTRPLVLLLDDVHWADPASIELLGALLRRPPAAPVLLAVGVRPRQLAERLALLSDGARLVLEGAAVAGDPFEPELAAAAADASESEAMDAIDELLRLDLVRETDVPRRFRFRHPLIRRAVYEATPGGWRLAAHARSAEALAAVGASVLSRAHHVEQAARRGDVAAVAVLREAGLAAAERTPASAARWF